MLWQRVEIEASAGDTSICRAHPNRLKPRLHYHSITLSPCHLFTRSPVHPFPSSPRHPLTDRPGADLVTPVYLVGRGSDLELDA